jgi:hypothetical protein
MDKLVQIEEDAAHFCATFIIMTPARTMQEALSIPSPDDATNEAIATSETGLDPDLWKRP